MIVFVCRRGFQPARCCFQGCPPKGSLVGSGCPANTTMPMERLMLVDGTGEDISDDVELVVFQVMWS